ncbi:MAG: phosphate acyltransferase PlsX [Candidatus Marinimicrobia bacterium]|nr:phosphate acyltransferase PlsX [Candidatus Neomarinimicrobiota bacterium]
MIVAVDAMGGDFAPDVVVQGAIQAIESSSVNIVLVGDEIAIQTHLGSFESDRITIHHAPELVSMDEPGSRIVKSKPNSSIVQGLKLVKTGKADAFVSAGNTGAVLASTLLLLGRIPGVRRPALAAHIPSDSGGKLICDVGANPDAKANHLLQFAQLASYYYSHVEGKSEPNVGLVNIGEEPNKGSELYLEAYQLLTENIPRFIGNVEGRDIMSSNADVLICDGFVGNTLIKFAENWIVHLGQELKRGLKKNWVSRLGGFLVKPTLRALYKIFDYEEHGGVPLLGVNGVAIISHGSSGPKSIMNSIFAAKRCVESDLITHTRESFETLLRDSA